MLTMLVGPLLQGPVQPYALDLNRPCAVQYRQMLPPAELVLTDTGPWTAATLALSDGPCVVLARTVLFTLDGVPHLGVEAEAVTPKGSDHFTVSDLDDIAEMDPITPVLSHPHVWQPVDPEIVAEWNRCRAEQKRCLLLASDANRIRLEACDGQILSGALAGGTALGGGGAIVGGAVGSVPGAAIGGVVGCVVGVVGGAFFSVERCRTDAESSHLIDINRCTRQYQWCMEDSQ